MFSPIFWQEITLYAIDYDQKRFRTPFFNILEPLWKSALNHTQLSGTSENESYVSVFFSVWVCLGKCVSVFGEWLDPELAELVVRVWGQLVSQWLADWHHLYCSNNRSIWLSSPNLNQANTKHRKTTVVFDCLLHQTKFRKKSQQQNGYPSNESQNRLNNDNSKSIET